MPSIRTFRTFLAAIDHAAFAGARKELGLTPRVGPHAKSWASRQELGLTPAAVGLQIRAMEREMKQVFFERGGRSVVLNTAGRGAMPQFEELVRHYEALMQFHDTDEHSGTVVMGALADRWC